MRKRFKIPLWFVLVVILALAGGYLYLRNSSFIRDRATAAINNALSARYPLRVTIDDLSGNYFTNLTARGITLTYDDGTTVAPLARIAKLDARYRLWDLWRGRWVAERLRFVEPAITIPVDTTGARLWPRALEEGEAGLQLVDFDVESIDIENGSVAWFDTPRPFDLDSIFLKFNIRAQSGELLVNLAPSHLRLRQGQPLALSAAGRILEGRWTIDSAVVRSPRTTVQISGDSAAIAVAAAPLDLDELSPLVGTRLRGRVDYIGELHPFTRPLTGSGTLDGVLQGRALDSLAIDWSVDGATVTAGRLRGRVTGAQVNGRGSLDLSGKPERYRLVGSVAGFDLARFSPGTPPTELSGHIDLSGVGLTDESLTLRIEMRLRAGHFDSYTFDSIAGPITVTAGDVHFEDGFTAWHRASRLAATGRIGYRDSLDVLVDVESSDLRPYDRFVFADSLAGRGRGFCYWSGPVGTPHLAGVIDCRDLRTYDLTGERVHIRFDIDRFFEDNRRGRFEAYWGASDLWGWGADSLLAVGRVNGFDVRFDSLGVRFPDWHGAAAGRLNWEADTIPVRLTPVAIEWDSMTFAAEAPVNFVIDTAGFEFESFTLTGPVGSVQAKGGFGYDESLDFEAQIVDFQFARYWKRLFPEQPLVGGLSLDATVTGELESPVIAAFGRAHSLEYDGGGIGALIGPISYIDRRLTTDGLTWAHEDFFLSAVGEFPVDLAFAERAARVLDRPQRLHVTGSGSSLNLAARFVPDVLESIRGTFGINVELTGTPRRPEFSGTAALSNGTVKALEVVDPLTAVDVRLRFQGDTAHVEHATAVVKHKRHAGDLSAGGRIRILDPTTYHYDLEIHGEDVPVEMEFQDFFLRTDFDLTVTGATPPLVGGRVVIIRAEDREEFTANNETALPDSTLWDWDLAVSAPGNYWIRNSNLDAQLSLDLRMQRRGGIIGFLGTAQIERGKLMFYDRTGRIDYGNVVFDDLSIPYPQLDIGATFRIERPPTAAELEGGGRGEPVQLKVLVTGRSDEPRIAPDPTNDPPHSEEDMLALLTAGATTRELFESGGNLYVDRLRLAGWDLAFKEALGRLREVWDGDISVTPSSNFEDTQLLIGAYAGPNLYLYGASTLDAAGEQNLGFEYRFGRRLYLEGRREQRADHRELYRLNLHFNWEF